MVRRLAAFIMLALGAWLAYGAVDAVLRVMSYGSDLASSLLEPPTGLIRLIASGLMILGGLLALFKRRGGALIASGGVLLFTLLAALMAASGADSGLWLDEALYAALAVILAVLLLSQKRT